MKKSLLVLVLITAISNITLGQTTDSLKSLLVGTQGAERVDLLHQLIISVWLKDTDIAMLYGKEALEISERLEDSTNISQSLRLIGGVHYYKGNYDKSLVFNRKAIDIALLISDSSLISNGYNNIGLLYYNLGNYQTALEYLLRSKELKQKIGETYGLPSTINNIGLVFDKIFDFKKARKNFFEALDISLQTENKDQQVYSRNNIGLTYLKENKNKDAYEYFKKALAVANEINNINWGAVSLRSIGQVLHKEGNYDSAKYYYQHSLEASKRIEDRTGIAEVYYLMAKLLFDTGNNSTAIDLLNKSHEIATLIKIRRQLLDNLILYSTIYQSNNDMENVILYQSKYSNLRDSLFRNALKRNLSLIPIKLKEEQDRKKLSEQQSELKRKNWTNTIYTIILIGIIPVIVFLIILLRKLKNANIEVSKQKDLYKANYESVKILSEIEAKFISTLFAGTIKEVVYGSMNIVLHENLNKFLPGDSLYFGLYNKKKKILEFPGIIEKGKKLSGTNYHVDNDSDRLAVQCFNKQEIILTNDLENDYPDHPQPLVGEQPISVIHVPLFQKTKVIGVLCVQSFERNTYTDYHTYFLKNLAAYISIAIENAQTYGELEKSYAQLQELNEYKEAMTAMIIHDFKNSLNTVISFSEGTPSEKRLKSIRQAGQFMLNMVLNMLDVQKFEAAEIKLALGNHPISKVINEAVNQLSYMMEQKSIKLTTTQKEELFVQIDYELITRAIVNILSNAIKYVPTNGSIEIITEKKDNVLLLSIKDNGAGIPADKIHIVFDKFSQIKAKKSGSVRSTGIGLTFCKMVVKAHKGTIGVESIEGQGSNFYFTLPISERVKDQKPKMEKIDILEDKTIMFSEKEQELLKPFLTELQQWEVYDYSEVTSIIKKVNTGNVTIDVWKERLLKALQNVNEDEYLKLVNP